MPGSSSWMPYAPQGVKGFDDDDDDVIFQSAVTIMYKGWQSPQLTRVCIAVTGIQMRCVLLCSACSVSSTVCDIMYFYHCSSKTRQQSEIPLPLGHVR